MNFTKMHGAGNDYIYVNCFEQRVENPCREAVRLSRRHFSVGADGLVLICPSKRADCFMDIYNADGSQAQMCGNAVRCTAKYIYDRYLKKPVISVDTLSGIKSVEIFERGGRAVGGRVNMGKPVLCGRLIPSRFGSAVVCSEKITAGDREYEITCVSMGNPHCVVFCENTDFVNLGETGRLLERHEMFPERTNAEFVEITGKNSLKMRVWERGSGETLACGTGACAAAVAAVINGFCEKGAEIAVKVPGGKLSVRWAESDEVYLSGNAVEVFEGTIY